jgi:hypothetical protein
LVVQRMVKNPTFGLETSFFLNFKVTVYNKNNYFYFMVQ